MAVDKAVDSAVLDANLTSIADAIRAKAGISDKLASPAGFAEAIAAITAGGGGEGGYDFSGLPTPFTLAISGSFVLDADTRCTNYTISVPNSINFTASKPVIALIFSNDTEIIYSSTVKTVQVLLSYDEGPTVANAYKQRAGMYACSSTTGSYSSGVWGALSKNGSDFIDYGYRTTGTISISNLNSAIQIKANPNLSEFYYPAGKKYYWLLLGCEA